MASANGENSGDVAGMLTENGRTQPETSAGAELAVRCCDVLEEGNSQVNFALLNS